MDNLIKAKLLEAEHHSKKNWLLSEDILYELIADHPDTFKAYEMLYLIYMTHRLFKKAEKIIAKGLVVFPDSSQLNFLMGNVYLAQKGKAHKALEWYSKIRIETPEMLFNKSVALVYLDRRKEAVSYFKEIMPYFNNLVSTYTFLAEQYVALKEWDNAISVLKSAEKKFPASKEVAFFIGKCFDNKKTGYRHLSISIKLPVWVMTVRNFSTLLQVAAIIWAIEIRRSNTTKQVFKKTYFLLNPTLI